MPLSHQAAVCKGSAVVALVFRKNIKNLHGLAVSSARSGRRYTAAMEARSEDSGPGLAFGETIRQTPFFASHKMQSTE